MFKNFDFLQILQCDLFVTQKLQNKTATKSMMLHVVNFYEVMFYVLILFSATVFINFKHFMLYYRISFHC